MFFHFLRNPEIKTGAYNAGFENIKILDIGKKSTETNAKIYITKSNDNSHIDKICKIVKTGFSPKFKVEDAIKEVKKVFK